MDLFPKIEPYDRGMLDVGDGHTLYYEQTGNPRGVPVVFLHGGPGAGSNPAHRRFLILHFIGSLFSTNAGPVDHALLHQSTTIRRIIWSMILSVCACTSA